MCRVDSLEVATCVCDFQCPKTVKSVCGSDGLTYDNDCQRKSAQCKLKKEIELVKNGQCVKVKDSNLSQMLLIKENQEKGETVSGCIHRGVLLLMFNYSFKDVCCYLLNYA